MDGKQIKEFYRKFADILGIRFVDKSVIGKIIGLITKRIPNKYASYIPKITDAIRPCALGNVVLLNFAIGCLEVDWKTQICKAVHEAEHCLQIRKFTKRGGKALGWYEMYFTNGEFRATQEGAASAAEDEVFYALTGLPPTMPDLRLYFVGETAQHLSNIVHGKHVDQVIKVGRGSATFQTSSLAISTLREMGVKIK